MPPTSTAGHAARCPQAAAIFWAVRTGGPARDSLSAKGHHQVLSWRFKRACMSNVKYWSRRHGGAESFLRAAPLGPRSPRPRTSRTERSQGASARFGRREGSSQAAPGVMTTTCCLGRQWFTCEAPGRHRRALNIFVHAAGLATKDLAAFGFRAAAKRLFRRVYLGD